MLLQKLQGFDFEMKYYNADGNESSMCGNGGRCISAFANLLGICKEKCYFLAIDGEHEAWIKEKDYVELKMGKVSDISLFETHCYLNTGSPHDIRFVENSDSVNVFEEGKKIRYSEPYTDKGVNVNFTEVLSENNLKVYTYERGVEDETLACGTGVTAASIAYFLQKTNKTEGNHIVNVVTKCGNLKVQFDYFNEEFSNILLCGPAVYVFKGEISVECRM